MNTVIYQKTLLGEGEINQRSDAVNSRLRRLLIMIDGRKTIDQLSQMAPVEDIHEALRQLTELHLIEPHKTTMAELIAGTSR